MIDRLTAALPDRYRSEREIGAGGMATVYLAADLKHDRRVAVKVLRPELAAVIGGERFPAEIRTTANLQHPLILPLFDSGEDDGFLWYAMPCVEGAGPVPRIGQSVAIASSEDGFGPDGIDLAPDGRILRTTCVDHLADMAPEERNRVTLLTGLRERIRRLDPSGGGE